MLCRVCCPWLGKTPAFKLKTEKQSSVSLGVQRHLNVGRTEHPALICINACGALNCYEAEGVCHRAPSPYGGVLIHRRRNPAR